MRLGIILNPNSKKNKKDPQRKERLQQLIAPKGGLLVATKSLEEIRPTLEHFIQEGVTHFLSDGGDGTFHWVVNFLHELVEEGRLETFPPCLPTNSGTMNCANHKVGVLGTGEEIISRLLEAKEPLQTYSLPTMWLKGTQIDGSPIQKICFSGALAGIGPNFFEKYYANPNRGPVTMVAVIIKGLLSMLFHLPPFCWLPGIPTIWKQYSRDLTRSTSAQVFLDGQEIPLKQFRVINIGAYNQKFAHVIRLFPFGKEGKLHCTVGHLSMFGIALNVPSLIFGWRLRGKQLWDQPGEKLECLCYEEKGFYSNFDGEVFSGFKQVSLTPGPLLPIVLC